MADKKPCSIFNEVFGPVMIGPSSSHTAGPARIGRVVSMLLDGNPESVVITFAEHGSYAATYKAQGSNYGFIGGILGIGVSEEGLKSSLETAAGKGITVSFLIEKMPPSVHPNYARISIKKANFSRVVESVSTGGGAFEITSIDGFPVSIKGDSIDMIVFCGKDARQDIEKIALSLEKNCIFDYAAKNNSCMADIKLDHNNSGPLLQALQNHPAVREVRCIEAVQPVIKKNGIVPPFMSAQDALEYAREKQCALWELASLYEETISGKTRSSIVTMMTEIVQVMRESALKGIAGEGAPRGFLGPAAGKIEKNIHLAGTKLVDMGVLNEVMVWATAVMEYDIRRGRVVAAPTGGSCGVLPAAVVLIGERMGKADEEIAKALLSAGLVGVFIDHFATFAAEICGCQAENGAAGSMAAAGGVDLLGGSPEEAFAASSLALQNILGMICDPVAGVGNVPCVSRNALSAVNAILSANMVLSGFDPFVPLDETIQAMMEVGRLMPEEHRCTARGGLCVTPSALRAQKLMERPLE